MKQLTLKRRIQRVLLYSGGGIAFALGLEALQANQDNRPIDIDTELGSQHWLTATPDRLSELERRYRRIAEKPTKVLRNAIYHYVGDGSPGSRQNERTVDVGIIMQFRFITSTDDQLLNLLGSHNLHPVKFENGVLRLVPRTGFAVFNGGAVDQVSVFDQLARGDRPF